MKHITKSILLIQVLLSVSIVPAEEKTIDIKVHEGWTSLNKKVKTLNGFQPKGTIDTYTVRLLPEAQKELIKYLDSLPQNEQLYIKAEGELRPDDDFKAPDGEFIIHHIISIKKITE